MSNQNFCDIFQRSVSSDSYIEMSIDDLLVASAEASTAQYPLNDKKKAAIVKSLSKGEPLYIAPVIASFMGKNHTAGGRHRVASADQICREYGINAKGKLELYTEVNRAALSPIGRTMLVDAVVVDSLKTLSALILASNESRTMTAPEKSSVKAEGGYATPGDRFKLRMAPILAANLDLTDEGGVPITVTAVTLAQIAGKLATSIKNVVSATDEQLNTIAGHLNEHLNNEDLPTKFAQFHGTFVAEFLSNPVELTDDDGEPVVNYDADGHEIVMSYAAYMTSQLPTVVKVAKAGKKSTIDADRLAKMEAALLAAGITV